MTHITTAQLPVTVRSTLIAQSGLAASFVRNAASLYGTDLDKNGTDAIFSTITHSDVMFVFEIISRSSGNDVSFTEPDSLTGAITVTRSYDVKLTAYGDTAQDKMFGIIARIRTDKIRQQLYDSGIYLQDASHPTLYHEFINGSVWTRSDATLRISTETTITPATADDTADTAGEMTITEI